MSRKIGSGWFGGGVGWHAFNAGSNDAVVESEAENVESAPAHTATGRQPLPISKAMAINKRQSRTDVTRYVMQAMRCYPWTRGGGTGGSGMQEKRQSLAMGDRQISSGARLTAPLGFSIVLQGSEEINDVWPLHLAT